MEEINFCCFSQTIWKALPHLKQKIRNIELLMLKLDLDQEPSFQELKSFAEELLKYLLVFLLFFQQNWLINHLQRAGISCQRKAKLVRGKEIQVLLPTPLVVLDTTPSSLTHNSLRASMGRSAILQQRQSASASTSEVLVLKSSLPLKF